MLVAIYGDVHLTKKMGNLQEHWDESAVKLFSSMYNEFASKDVESAICLGDFFDAPRLEAKSVKLVTRILSIINESPFPTYFLLGNHEIFDDESNILEYLSEYENIIPITQLTEHEGKLFIPYNVKIEDVDPDLIKGKYVFTHHDIYGSELAGGKVKASFGTDPILLKDALKVFNGHVHLSSKLGNIFNVGSLLKSQQGELRMKEFPSYYFLGTNSGSVEKFDVSRHFIAYLSPKSREIEDVLRYYYDPSISLVLRIPYSEDSDIVDLEEYKSNPKILKMSLQKLLKNSLDSKDDIVHKTNLDVKEIITNYIKQDTTVEENSKSRLISIGLELLEV